MAPSEKTQRKVLELTKKQVCAIAACDYNTNLAEGDHKADLQQSLIDLMLQVTQCNQCGGQCCFSKHLFDVTKPPFAPAGGDGDVDDDDDDDDDEEQDNDHPDADARLAAAGLSTSPSGSSSLNHPTPFSHPALAPITTPLLSTTTSAPTTTTQSLSAVTTAKLSGHTPSIPPLSQSELLAQLASLSHYPTSVAAQQSIPFTSAVSSLSAPPHAAPPHAAPPYAAPQPLAAPPQSSQQNLQVQQFQQFLLFQQQQQQQQQQQLFPGVTLPLAQQQPAPQITPQATAPPVLDTAYHQLDALKSQIAEQQRLHQAQMESMMAQMRSLLSGAPPPIAASLAAAPPSVPYPPLATSTAPLRGTSASFTNECLAAACGVIPTQLRSIESSETNYWGHKKKLPSGMYTDNDRDVLQQCRWPHKALDDSWYDKPPEYYDLDKGQFAAGFAATILMQLPIDQSNSTTANMLKHLNRLFTYSAKFPWKQVLILHHKFMAAVEQRTMNWTDWDAIKRWHLLKLESLYASKDDAKAEKSAKDLSDPSKKVSFGVEVGIIKSSNLCLKFQSESCSQDPDHLSPHGGETTLAHHCAWCFHKLSPRVSAAQSARSCPERKKSFSARGGKKGATPP